MKYKKVQSSLLIGMFEKYSMFCDITIQNIKIFIKLLTVFFRMEYKRNAASHWMSCCIISVFLW